MIGAILTQNTSWRNVSRAIEKIRRANLLQPKRLLTQQRKIPQLIKTSGSYHTKAKYLRAFLKYFVSHYNGSAQKMAAKETLELRDELLAIPGIGPQTADSILLYALNKRVFVIDTYTRRILSRHDVLSYHLPYADIQQAFEQHLPARTRLYNEYHALLVSAGKRYCRKHEPLCNICPLYPMLPRS